MRDELTIIGELINSENIETCPVCGHLNAHIESVDDNYAEKLHVTIITIKGECDHMWAVAYGDYKGVTSIKRFLIQENFTAIDECAERGN